MCIRDRFEAIHGSAPRRAGQNLANPSGLLLGSVMMLVHLGQTDIAERVHNAWLKTLEDGVHTYDIFKDGISTQKVGTKEFAEAVVARIGQVPSKLKVVKYNAAPDLTKNRGTATAKSSKRDLVGVDVFLNWNAGSPNDLGAKLKEVGNSFKLASIGNRGTKVWPEGEKDTFCTDHWRARFIADNGTTAANSEVIDLLQKLQKAGFDFIKTEHLYNFDGKPGFSA